MSKGFPTDAIRDLINRPAYADHIPPAIEAAAAQLGAIEAAMDRLAEAERDSSRLDWLDDGMDRLLTIDRSKRRGGEWWRVREIDTRNGRRAPNGEICQVDVIANGTGGTLRRAIDKAIASRASHE